MRIKKFESYGQDSYLSTEDINDLFIELIDNGFSIKIYQEYLSNIGKYFFEFKKSYADDSFGNINYGQAYGFTDLHMINKEISSCLEYLEKIKERIYKMGYTIAFEFEFNFSISSHIIVVCHMQHSKYNTDPIDEVDNIHDQNRLF
jgi:hypothetical protein